MWKETENFKFDDFLALPPIFAVIVKRIGNFLKAEIESEHRADTVSDKHLHIMPPTDTQSNIEKVLVWANNNEKTKEQNPYYFEIHYNNSQPFVACSNMEGIAHYLDRAFSEEIL